MIDPGREPTRARYPDREGFAERDGVRIFYEVYEPQTHQPGRNEPTLLFFYPWAISHSRQWKPQIPYLARHHRVVVFDQRGGGRSDRPRTPGAYRLEEHIADVLSVMDASESERAILVTVSIGARAALWLAANHPGRVAGAALIGPFVQLTPWPPERTRRRTFLEPRASRRALMTAVTAISSFPTLVRSASARRFMRQVQLTKAFNKFNRDYWLRDQRGFLEWFFPTITNPDPHSTRQIEDAVDWGMETDAQTLVQSFTELDIDARALLTDRAEILACCERVKCPVLVIHGDEDIVSPPEWGTALAEATRGRVRWIEGCGHSVHGRKPVAVNLALREFAESVRSVETHEAEVAT